MDAGDPQHLLGAQKGAGVLKLSRQPGHGFNVVELMVAMAIAAILGVLVVPSVTEWIRNARVRSTAEALQNGLRLAQNEAIRQGRQVVLTFTNATPALDATPTANGTNWSAQTVAVTGDPARFISGGPMGDLTAGIAVNTNAVNAVCFGSTGTLMPNGMPGPTGAICTTNTLTVDVSFAANAASAKTLRVSVSVGGRIRMCDPDKTFSATAPDGC